MELLLGYLIKSTICISVFYLIFRWTLKRENLFALNRFLLLTILVSSLAIPLIKLPELFHQSINVKVFPEKNLIAKPNMDDVAMQITTIPTTQYTTVSTERTVYVEQLTTIIYAMGVLTLFVALLIALAKIGLLLFNTKVYRRKNYNLALVNGTISPMSFGNFIIMSKQDFKDHRKEILKHELAHIKFKHTYDLLLVELVKLFHWFNPLVYQLRNDLKEIQEFQVDRHLLKSGINSKEYQLLLIKKCVGTERYALANSFNHCQIKNRIVMMNNSKNSKGKSWKVAIFLPVAALILMAFSKTRERFPITDPVSAIINLDQTEKKWEQNNFKTISEEELKNQKEHDFFNGVKWNNVLINRYSKIMSDGKVIPLTDLGISTAEKLQSDINRYQNSNKSDNQSILSFKVLIRKDVATNHDDFNALLNTIAVEFSNAREKLSFIQYNSAYESLNSSEQDTINQLIPQNIFIVNPPKKMNINNRPLPPPSTLKITTEGIFLGEKYTLDELKNLVEFNSASGSKMRFILKIETGVPQSHVDEVKAVLKNCSIIRIEEYELKPPPAKTKATKNNNSDETKANESKTTSDYIKTEESENASSKLSTPQTTNSTYTKHQTATVETTVVKVFVDGEKITLNGESVSIEKLAYEINQLYPENSPTLIANVNFTKETKADEFQTVKQELRKTKALHINYSSANKTTPNN